MILSHQVSITLNFIIVSLKEFDSAFFNSQKNIVLSTGDNFISKNWLLPLTYFLSAFMLIAMSLAIICVYGNKIARNEF